MPPRPLRESIRDAVLDAWSVLMPVECAGCGRPDRALCAACHRALAPVATPRSLPDGTRLITVLRYQGAVREVVLAFKEHERVDVAMALAVALRAAVRAALAEADTTTEVTWVPSSRRAYRRRGYDPVRMLLRRSGMRPARVLRPPVGAARQKTLHVEERARNAAGRFRARQRLEGRRFVLVDDVVTTGSTLADAARAIRDAGGEVVATAALAYTPRLLRHSGDWSVASRDFAIGEG